MTNPLKNDRREELIKDLKEVCKTDMLGRDGIPEKGYVYVEDKIADFILAREAKIVVSFIRDLKDLPIIHSSPRTGFNETDLWKLIHKYEGNVTD